MFSNSNEPFFGPLSRLARVPRNDGPSPLVRSTNDRYHYYGAYPLNCAQIATASMITRMIGESALHIKRHVVEVPVFMQIGKQDVVRKINQLVGQLEAFSDVCTWEKKKNVITVTFKKQGRARGEEMDFECYVCDDTGHFHILVSKGSLWSGTAESGPQVNYPDMDSDDMNKLIYSIRRIYQDKDNLTELPDLDKESWESMYDLTREKSTEFVHFTPEWMDDAGAEWNFPETEPFEDVPPLDLGDILERLSLQSEPEKPENVAKMPAMVPATRELEEGEIYEGEVESGASSCFEVFDLFLKTIGVKRSASESEDAPPAKKARVEVRGLKRFATESEDAPPAKKARVERQEDRGVKRLSEGESEDAPPAKKARVSREPEPEQAVFEVEECEEPPYKKRRLNSD